MAEITREELQAFTEAHTKSSVALEKIAEKLTDITTKQDKLIDKLTNGITTSIITGVTDNYNTVHKETIMSLSRIETGQKDIRENMPNVVEEKIKNSNMARDIEHTKWFVAIVGIVVVVAMVILRSIEINDTMKKIAELKSHTIVTDQYR